MNFSINLGIFVIIGMIMGCILVFMASFFRKRFKEWLDRNSPHNPDSANYKYWRKY